MFLKLVTDVNLLAARELDANAEYFMLCLEYTSAEKLPSQKYAQ